ncbi:hypothetical protein CEXT_172441 [Caerostris extrusa]|uniref:Uncharacterized protein n=1 Tax=Caerostris extrusa TaxID=172846 RepID=A0AAV4RPG8_CAEEX|nr:hypothetical protein CEXT_172441 [Caerostris extrusa]
MQCVCLQTTFHRIRKPSFPSCPSNTPQGSGSRRKEGREGHPQRTLLPHPLLHPLREVRESSETTDKGDNKEVGQHPCVNYKTYSLSNEFQSNTFNFSNTLKH